MAITTEQIKELREATGVGILDCRDALEKAGGDFDKAVDYLREKGLAKAAKRSGREAADGVIKLYSHGDGRIGVMVEVNCETDFVARTDDFQALIRDIAMHIAAAEPRFVSRDEVTDDETDAGPREHGQERKHGDVADAHKGCGEIAQRARGLGHQRVVQRRAQIGRASCRERVFRAV